MGQRNWISSFGFMAIVFLFTGGCADFKLTAPLCGTGSADNAPIERLPANAGGCYEGTPLSISVSQSILRPMSSEAKHYLWIYNVGQSLVVGASGDDVPATYGGLCKNPVDQTGRSFVSTSLGGSDGWWTIGYVTFSQNGDRIYLGGTRIDFGKLKTSGIRHSIFPSANFRTDDSNNYSSNPLESSIGMTLIDNRGIPTAELFERLGIEAASVVMTLIRVPDDLCGNAAMRFYKHAGPDLRESWQPARADIRRR